MQISYKWLKDYVDLQITPDELAAKMTLAGIAIDEIDLRGHEVSNVVTARVEEKAFHPASDHLSVCRVNDGKDEYTVVCGAPNVAQGQVVVLARVGATLPGGVSIGVVKVAGVQSFGMLCSGAELGYDASDSKGIMVLPADTPLGLDIVDYLDYRDDVLILDLTPNRSDCFSVVNCAREAATVSGAVLKLPVIQYQELGNKIEELASISVEDFSLCSRYVGRLVQGVKVGPSPRWMQNYLLASGMRPINNVVDIANFVLLELGQPLHTFDYAALHDKKLVIRSAREGEKIVTLDEKERQLIPGDILICDGDRPVCIAGVMGGLNSEVTDQTTDILIESACFNPLNIRHTSRRLGLPSEAAARFEKGIDWQQCDRAAKRACQLMVQYCGGTAAQGAIDISDKTAVKKAPVPLRLNKVNDRLGTSYSMEDIAEVMHKLAFPVTREGDMLLVSIPSYRPDISIEVDLIEEVARLRSYEEIPLTLPFSCAQGERSKTQKQMLDLRSFCADFGLLEVVNYSFISPKEWDKLLLKPDSALRATLNISNPMSEDQSIMRTTLLPGILGVIARNNSRRNLDLAVFETGAVFFPRQEAQPDEPMRLAVALSGELNSGWQGDKTAYDYFYLKGFVESLSRHLRVCSLQFCAVEADQYPYLHPGRAAQLLIGGQKVGYLGELHPIAAANYDLEKRVSVLELDLTALFAASQDLRCCDELPKYPAVSRDMALIGSSDIAAADISSLIAEVGAPLLQKVELFDLYDKPPILPGQRSLAFALSFRHKEHTLTDAEVNEAFDRIVSALDEKWGLKLR